ncbi:MAG TPA: hypothetical protein VEO54_18435 [Thermoanaerobaculia bacterium]|nr:hypothetical protein [Thermoanaerobaculia bacterium]
MRRLSTPLAIILLHCLAAAGGERVNVGQPMMTVAPTTEHLRQRCGVEGNYDACTRFVAYRLDAACTDEGRIAATATFRPWIILRNLHSLSHEHEHIGDVRRSVEAFLTGLESLRFSSAEECRARVLEERASFGTTMRAYALASNLERHPR